MRTRVLSLARTPERLRAFGRRNPWLDAEPQVAVDGRTMDRTALVAAGIIGPGIPHSDGALGALLSHHSFWEDVAESGEPMAIFEDDAIVHEEFADGLRICLQRMDDDWQFIALGWNFDALMQFEILPGVTCRTASSLEGLRANISNYSSAPFFPEPFRLHRMWGFCGYAISPAGARFFLDQPIIGQKCNVAFPDLGQTIYNDGVDAIVNAFYPTMKAYVCIPPLVVTTQDESTIVPGLVKEMKQ